MQGRLCKIRQFMDEKHWQYNYREDEGCGVLEFLYRDRSYHIWEFQDDDGSFGAESNVRTCGRMEDFTGEYQEQILEIIRAWLRDERAQAGRQW
ncbi:MAG: kinase [Lachnospiraceae bacterium]|nr:kinase [Lachnospiraceae bacterium]